MFRSLQPQRNSPFEHSAVFILKCIWCQVVLKEDIKLPSRRVETPIPTMLPFAPHQALKQQNNLHVDFYIGRKCGTGFLKKHQSDFQMRDNRCESDINMLKPCKQPDRSTASSDSCVALVMIFQEAHTKIHRCCPEAQPDPEPPPEHLAACVRVRHRFSLVIHNTHQSTPSTPLEKKEKRNMGRSASKNGRLSLRLSGAWNRLYITLAKEQQSENFGVFFAFFIAFYSCNQTYGCSHTFFPPLLSFIPLMTWIRYQQFSGFLIWQARLKLCGDLDNMACWTVHTTLHFCISDW